MDGIAGSVAVGIATTIVQTIIRTLSSASFASENANDKIAGLKSLVKQVGQAAETAERKHGPKLHDDGLRERIQELKQLHQTFIPRIESVEKWVQNNSGLCKYWKCCLAAATGFDEIDIISADLEGKLEAWLLRQSMGNSLDDAIETYAQGLPSYLTLQSEDGYKPLEGKLDIVCQLLESSAKKAVLVHGLSGIGKSSLAHYVATNRLPKRFSNGAVKLLLGYGCSRKAVGSIDEYHRILSIKLVHFMTTQLGYEDNLQDIDLQSLCHMLQETLREKKYLVILDDVWEPDIMVRFMKFSGNDCKYLVTTRIPSIMGRTADKVEIVKDDLQHVGKAILQYHSDMDKLPDIAEELLDRCGFHPLTLTVLGQALEHETRPEQWLQALENLRIYADKASVVEGYFIEDGQNAATVFGSLEFSLKAMEQSARELFVTFASISWSEPIPEACLEAFWCKMKPPTTFRMDITSLVKASLIGKHKSYYSYIVHDMVALYLDARLDDAFQLLELSDPERCISVVPWLLRYGKPRARQVAWELLLQVLQSDRESLQSEAFSAMINVCSQCRMYKDVQNTSRAFILLVRPEIPGLFSRISVGQEITETMVRFIGTYFTDQDWECLSGQLVDAGALEKLSPLLVEESDALKSAVQVLTKLAKLGIRSGIGPQLLKSIPIHKLIALLDPAQKSTRDLIGSQVMMALIFIVKAGGESALKQLFAAGLGEKMVLQIKSDYEEFDGKGMRELNQIREHYLEGGSQLLQGFLETGLLETLASQTYIGFFLKNFDIRLGVLKAEELPKQEIVAKLVEELKHGLEKEQLESLHHLLPIIEGGYDRQIKDIIFSSGLVEALVGLLSCTTAHSVQMAIASALNKLISYEYAYVHHMIILNIVDNLLLLLIDGFEPQLRVAYPIIIDLIYTGLETAADEVLTKGGVELFLKHLEDQNCHRDVRRHAFQCIKLVAVYSVGEASIMRMLELGVIRVFADLQKQHDPRWDEDGNEYPFLNAVMDFISDIKLAMEACEIPTLERKKVLGKILVHAKNAVHDRYEIARITSIISDRVQNP